MSGTANSKHFAQVSPLYVCKIATYHGHPYCVHVTLATEMRALPIRSKVTGSRSKGASVLCVRDASQTNS